MSRAGDPEEKATRGERLIFVALLALLSWHVSQASRDRSFFLSPRPLTAEVRDFSQSTAVK